MIPESKTVAVALALREAFGVTEFEDIKRLTVGSSSRLVFRIGVQGRPYLLRIIMSTDATSDPTREFTCMRSAAEAGLSPRVWYTSIVDRLSITDFVEAQIFPPQEALVRMPAMLRALHRLPPFPKSISHVDAVTGFISKFQAAGIMPESETAELFRLYSRVTTAYPRHDSDWVSSHNDLKPGNILFDGERAWLVDWETAFLNDPYADLALVGNFVIATDVDEEVFLRTYFAEAAGEYKRARFYLMRQVVHMFYTMGFFLIASSGNPVALDGAVPAFGDIHGRLWAGEVSLADREVQLQFARIHMHRLMQNLRTPRFEDALRIVLDRQPLRSNKFHKIWRGLLRSKRKS